jgi:succinoglycan biosynthesis protein ExoM
VADSADPERRNLTIAVTTYRRPSELGALLPLLLDQLVKVHEGDRFLLHRSEILVIDNDPAKSALEVAVHIGSVRYVCEPQPGISAARNRALDESTASQLLVFIDDDEQPVENWLGSMLETFGKYPSSAVAAAVISHYVGELDPWIEAGGFFKRGRPPTGTYVSVAATNNLLLDMRQIRKLGLRFDSGFGLTGGEDTLFTRRLVSSGGSIVWCNEAVVIDRVPASRMTRSWVLRRSLSSGNSWSLTALEVEDGTAARATLRARMLVAGLVRATGGTCRWAFGAVTKSQEHRAKGLKTSARGVGITLGVVGYRYQEYRRPSSPGEAT